MRLLVLILLLAAAVGCTSQEAPPPPTTLKPIDAATIAAVKVALGQDAELAPAGLQVTAAGHKVVLAGAVPSDAAKTKAEALARGVRGVTEVDNQLEVSP